MQVYTLSDGNLFIPYYAAVENPELFGILDCLKPYWKRDMLRDGWIVSVDEPSVALPHDLT